MGFGVVDIAAVAQGVLCTEGTCHAAGDAEDVAPGVVGVLYHRFAQVVQNGSYIALDVGDVVVIGSVPADGNGGAAGIVDEVHLDAAALHVAQLIAVVRILVSSASVGALGSQSVGVVGVVPCFRAIGHRRQLSAVLPGVGPGAVCQRVADVIVSDGVVTILGQQVAPFTVTADNATLNFPKGKLVPFGFVSVALYIFRKGVYN